jgi:thiamine-phosphate pyrophosphorylase
VDPVICLVTAGAARSTLELVDALRAAARAGVHLLQIRERELEARALFELVSASVAAVRGTGARVIVNDRADVALAAAAHGVHLRGDSMPARRVRALAPPGFIVGRSIRSADEAAAAAADGGLDYLFFGTVFPSSSKPGVAASGAAALAEAVSRTPLPVLAIGGVRRERAASIGEAGAAGFAAISLFDSLPGSFRSLVSEVRASFSDGARRAGRARSRRE